MSGVKEDFCFEILDKQKHNRNGFDCGVLELNDFIQKYANKQQGNHLNKVYVLVKRNHDIPKPILGYYSLNANSISFESIPKEVVKHIPQYPIPTIKIGRLARDIRTKGSGMGGVILGDALFKSLILSKKIGVFAVDVDAKNSQAKEFYKKYGFIELIDKSLSLILPMRTLEKTLRIFQNDKSITESLVETI